MDLMRMAMLWVLACAAAQATAQETTPAPVDAGEAASGQSRLRLFGQNGVGMVLYTDTVCTKKYAEKIRASGSLGSAFGSLLGSVKNESLGMPETATTRTLKQRGQLLSKAYYREYALVPGVPVVIEAGAHSPTGWQCDRLITSAFTPAPGKDYEAAFDVDFSDGVCTLKVNEVAADGQLIQLPVKPASKDCTLPVTPAAEQG